jgi:hypothetical protein
MTVASVDDASLQERLKAAKQEVALARRNEEADLPGGYKRII